jgi:omega-amidase
MENTNRSLKICLLQMDVRIGEPEANFTKIEGLLERAVKHESGKPDVIVMPEMWNTGYALDRIRDLADRDGERTKSLMSAFANKHEVYIVAGSIADLRGDGVYNTIYVFGRNGRMIADYSKMHLFRLMDEHLHLTAGDQACSFGLDGTEAGAMICYDIRFPELSRKLAIGGAKLLFVPAEWPHPRLHHWRTLLMARAIENQMYVVACNRVGRSGTADFFGHSMIIDPWGEVLAEGDETEQILSADLDLSLVDKVRETIPVFKDRRPELYV